MTKEEEILYRAFLSEKQPIKYEKILTIYDADQYHTIKFVYSYTDTDENDNSINGAGGITKKNFSKWLIENRDNTINNILDEF